MIDIGLFHDSTNLSGQSKTNFYICNIAHWLQSITVEYQVVSVTDEVISSYVSSGSYVTEDIRRDLRWQDVLFDA